jgi:hypothetical protein
MEHHAGPKMSPSPGELELSPALTNGIIDPFKHLSGVVEISAIVDNSIRLWTQTETLKM